MFKLKQFLAVALVFTLVATGMAAVSAEVDNVYDVFWSRDDVKMVPWYNHDNTVMKGPEYQAEVLKLLAAGYIPLKGYAISEYSGGAGQQYGSYDEDYFKHTNLVVVFQDDMGILFRTTPEELQYFDGENWVPVPDTMEVPIEVEELLLQEQFDHDAMTWIRTGRWPWQGYFGWVDTGSDTNEPFLTVINEDGTQAVWHIMDIYGTSMAMVVITGEEEWDTRTIIYELPQAGAGSPQLLPKNYGVNLVQKYGFASVEEARLWVEQNNLQEYVKYTEAGAYTYRDSIADILFGKEVYKINHDAYLAELEEDAHNKWLAARVTPYAKK